MFMGTSIHSVDALDKCCVVPGPVVIPATVFLDHMELKHHPVRGELFYREMREILYAMEYENIKRLLGWDIRCAGRNRIVTPAVALKEVWF